MTGPDASRRDFLKNSGLAAAVAVTRPDRLLIRPDRSSRSVIQILLTGGPSQLDTWDPKPQASEEYRGPFDSIATALPGVRVTEPFPKLARIADKIAFLRTMNHSEAPIHETGQQLLQTGSVMRGDVQYPHFGAVTSWSAGPTARTTPVWVGLPGPLGNTGVAISHGQEAGFLGSQDEPVWMSPDSMVTDLNLESNRARQAYGDTTFGKSCLLARRLVQNGARVVTINMFPTVFDQLSWDMHAYGGGLPTTLDDYKRFVCPLFDRVFSALITDLAEQGMLDEVMVVAGGEMGRTPKLNSRGGRDHWTGCWTTLVAGGGIRGGRVIGQSDEHGAYPKDRPIASQELLASIYQHLEIDSENLPSRPDEPSLPFLAARPISELLG